MAEMSSEHRDHPDNVVYVLTWRHPTTGNIFVDVCRNQSAVAKYVDIYTDNPTIPRIIEKIERMDIYE
jgi:hypothetical protein